MKFSHLYSAFSLFALALGMTDVTVDVNDASVTKTGPWGRRAGNIILNCPGLITNAAGSSVTLIFTGVSISLVGDKNNQGGFYQVSLDGQADPPVDRGIQPGITCGAALFQRTGLQNGQHNITVALGGPSPGSVGGQNLVVSNFVYTRLDPTDLPATTSVTSSTTTSSTTSTSSTSSTSSTTSSQSTSTTSNPVSTLAPQTAATSSSHHRTGVIVGAVIGSLAGLALLGALAALANHLIHKPPPPGAHPDLDHDFVFFVPPLRLGAGEKDLGPTQITLTLTPKDALENNKSPNIAWEVFHIGGENKKFQCKLPYDLAFGSVKQHETGQNTYPFFRFCPPGYSVAVNHRNGTDVWKKPQRQKDLPERVKATNASGVSRTIVLGSYHKDFQPPFHPFYLEPDIKHEGDYLDPPDLVLQAYRTQGCQKGQVIEPDKLTDNLYKGLVRSLDRVTTWRVRAEGNNKIKLEIVKNDTPMEEATGSRDSDVSKHV